MTLALYILLCFLVLLVQGFILAKAKTKVLNWIKIVYNTLGRDLKALSVHARTAIFLKRCYRSNLTIVDLFHKNVEKHPNEVCFVFEGEEWTYKQLNDLSNKFAQCFRLQGYRKGDEVALFMENCPDFISVWIGLAKIGVITAFINTCQKSDSLANSINVINAKGIIFGHSLSKPLEEAIPLLNKKEEIKFYCYSRKSEEKNNTLSIFKNLNDLLDDVPSTPLDPIKFKTNFSDKVLYLYTSGTTGYPKPAVFKHSRLLMFYAVIQHATQVTKSDIIYNALPMYHGAGGILFVTVVLISGGKMILKKRFSTHSFWKDAVKHKVTVCQYIGEICRYLLNTPVVSEESQHNIRLCFGNGLKPHVWKEVQERFKIPNIIEFYGCIEGNALTYNMTGKIGSVGYFPFLFSWLYPVRLVKVNLETGEFLKDKKGRFICCEPGEPGEIIGKVETSNPCRSFDGYLNSTATDKKIVRNCFQKGDIFFRSGDILVMDEYGFLTFVDRGGDTYRWKGENVSTSEVENIISKILNLSSCVVYGVEIPDTEGRAGMAAIEKDMDEADFSNLYGKLNEKIPCYAIPIFLRVCNVIEITNTFKLRKVNLQKEGYNPQKIMDPVYFIDYEKKTYIRLTNTMYSNIINRKIEL